MCILRPMCGLSMLHGICEIVHGAVRLGGLSTPNRGVLCACPFILSPRVLRSTLSHILYKLNLLIFLFSVGLLTHYVYGFLDRFGYVMVLPPYFWKFSFVVMWLVVFLWWCIGEGSFRCSLNLSPKVLEVSPMYSSSHTQALHIGTSRWSPVIPIVGNFYMEYFE